MIRPRLAILTVGELATDPGLPRWLASELALELPADVECTTPVPVDPSWRDDDDADRLLSNRVVDDLAAAAPPGTRTLALVDADLAAPGRRFVFGEATLGGPVAIIGLARLRSELVALSRLRALKESLHELGHLARLRHCDDPLCAMHPAFTVRDIDRRSAAFCDACIGRLRQPLAP